MIGEIRASENADEAPTVIAYGHFDVQPEAPLELWESPPFEPTVRDGWIYARGVADDKGQLYLLLKAAALLAAEGALPVNVRFTCDGEEECGGHSIVDFSRQTSAAPTPASSSTGTCRLPGSPRSVSRPAGSATSTFGSRPASATCTPGSSAERR